MGSLIKKAFGFLLHATPLRTNILILFIILASIPLTVFVTKKPQTIQQQAAVKTFPSPAPDETSPSPQPQTSTLFYIEPFTIDGIKKTSALNQPKDKNITFYLYNLTDDPETDPKEKKVFKKIAIPATYDKATNTFSSSKFSLENVPEGEYQILIKVNGSRRQFLGTKEIFINQTIIIQGKEIKLIMGDVNNDNEIDMLDYSMIMNCFEDKAVTSTCEKSEEADLNSDGIINSLDYDIFSKSLLVSETNRL